MNDKKYSVQSTKDIEDFSDVVRKNNLKKYSDGFKNIINSRISKDKSFVATIPYDTISFISDRYKTVSFCIGALKHNFSAFMYIPKKIQEDQDFQKFVIETYFDNKAYRSGFSKRFIRYHACENLKNTICCYEELNDDPDETFGF